MTEPAWLETGAAGVGDDIVMTASGQVDLATVGELRAGLDAAVDAAGGHLVLDLTGVTFFDVVGLSELARARRRLPPATTVTLVTTDPLLARVLTLTGQDRDLAVDCRPPPGRGTA